MSEELNNKIEEIGVKYGMSPEVREEVKKQFSDAGQLKTFFERIQRLEEEKREIIHDINQIYAEAKGQGYDPKVMKSVLKLCKMNRADVAESEYLRDEYKKMLGIED